MIGQNGLLARLSSSLHSASLLTRFLVVGVLFKLAKKPALLELHIEALESAVNGLIRLNGYVDQNSVPRKTLIMARFAKNLAGHRDWSPWERTI
jgi:hypothetical protein